MDRVSRVTRVPRVTRAAPVRPGCRRYAVAALVTALPALAALLAYSAVQPPHEVAGEWPTICGGAGPDLRAPAVDEASLGRRFHDFHADVARCITEIHGPQFDVAALFGDRLGSCWCRDDRAPDLYRDVCRK